MSLKLMYITNDEKVAGIAQAAGVDRIFIDMEYIGKEERQAGLDTVKLHHTVEDIKKVRPILTASELLVRVNPIHEATSEYCSSEEEIEQVINAGADIIMLPMFKTAQEVKRFVDCVAGRTKTMLLVENATAVENIDSILEVDGIDEIHIGLNDLHLSYGMKFMFELLANGTVEMLCNKFKKAGKPYGFGGIARIGYGTLPAEYVIKEHYRLGSQCAILSRAFCNVDKIDDISEIEAVFNSEMKGIRETEELAKNMTQAEHMKNHNSVIDMVNEIVYGKKPIKICALTTISKTTDWFIVDSMRNLSNNGYKVTLICNMEDGFAERNSDYAQCINIPMSRGASIKDLITIPFKLAKIFRKNKFDVIYYTSPNVSLYASIGGILAGVKNRIYSQCGLRYVSFEGLKRKIFRFIEKLTCSLSSTVRSQSPLNMQFAIDEKLCRADKISVVGIGGTTGVSLKECDCFDHEVVKQELRAKYGIPADAFLYGYVGRINADKGINELIEAFSRLQKENENVYLALIGMYDDTNPISEENWKLANNNRNIVLTGNVPTDEVYPHMAMLDVLVHPTYREGFGKVLQEAMGVRLPIITTNVPGPSEVVENGVSGLLCEVKDFVDLEKTMIKIYNDADLRASIAKAGRERAEKYFDRPIMLNNILLDLNKTINN